MTVVRPQINSSIVTNYPEVPEAAQVQCLWDPETKGTAELLGKYF